MLAVALALAGPAQATEPTDLRKLPFSTPTLVSSYGPSAVQFGELRVPAGKGPFPVAIIYHGGCLLRAVDDTRGTAAIATALAAKGIATWNVDYRALGDEGAGFPGTYLDWGAAADHLRVLARSHPLDLNRVVALGHSAGAPAAAFVGVRPKLPKDAEIRGADPLPIKAVFAIDGPPDPASLAGLDEKVCGGPIVKRFLGGTASDQADRYRLISPATHLPTGVPITMISSSFVLPLDLANAYGAKVVAAGDQATVVQVKGDHFNVIAPGQPQWAEVEALVLKAFR
jgi:acetyl esterase/lipase